jgi:hypothetical protein
MHQKKSLIVAQGYDLEQERPYINQVSPLHNL